ncbi:MULTISPECIES: ATP-dependent helicase [Pseudomonas fluorescens group]|uniref:DNA 3'-5' helicase n=1 Tax=Pseudomonas rustica TaxID=2827099 RepID=A0ABS5MR85_9PSED|nr:MULTISPECIES: ATP-dependent helicase [Pseudomonas fluorescens group]MBS4076792.1 ATP-dependent helicase [Pseudomonas rustica]CEL30593.1 DNA helicase II [Pseudomonas fluorescens]
MINPDRWAPSPGIRLEQNAWEVIRECGRSVVLTAGPGAGKTEVLAQRADFLLRTNNCRYPKRILAVSFKTDASRNLKQRIQMRCGVEHASRFDSVTFHGFAKRVIDKFRPVLVEEALDQDYVIGPEYVAGKQITFKQLLPFALKILKDSEVARNAIRTTYSHVFLDEFQDCTGDQYELIKLLFHDTSTILTAVGDTKQTIMGWAGALDGIFKTYADDFAARPLRLFLNFRSLPRLLRMQNDVIREIEAAAVMPDDLVDGDGGDILTGHFRNSAEEAEALAEIIQHWIVEERIPPNEIAILMPRQIEEYAEALMEQLARKSIPFRNDHELQDLLKEPAVGLVVDYLTCLYEPGQSEAWSRLMSQLAPFEDDDSKSSAPQIFEELFRSHKRQVAADSKTPTPYASWWKLVLALLKGLSASDLAAFSPDYQSRQRLTEVVHDVRDRIRAQIAEEPNLLKVLAGLSDSDSVRLLTMHKSKGLEFHSVILLGVETQAFWGKLAEERCVFFVGVSRAKQRLVLTTSELRPRPKSSKKRWDERRTQHGEFVSHVARHQTCSLHAWKG